MEARTLPIRGQQGFQFAFNRKSFSDRILRLEITAAKITPESTPDDHRRRGKEPVAEITPESTLESTPDDHRRQGKEPAAETSKGALESASSFQHDEESCKNKDKDGLQTTIISTKSIYVCSALLAAESQYFFALFENDETEPKLRETTLTINQSEEVAFMELLSFMYSGKLSTELESTTSSLLLLNVLKESDRFKVASCVHYCSQLLGSLAMDTESAVSYLELPRSISMTLEVQPLVNAARVFLVNSHKNLNMTTDKHMNEEMKKAMDLTIAGIEAVLSSSELRVDSEDTIIDFVLDWSRKHYPNLEERRQIIKTRLCSCIRFEQLSYSKLREVLTCEDFENMCASKAIIDALFFESEVTHQQTIIEKNVSASKILTKRAYIHHPLKVVEFVEPSRHSILYFDLKREDCQNLFPKDIIYSQKILLGDYAFILSAGCHNIPCTSSHYFRLFLGMRGEVITSPVNYEVAVRTRPSGDFVRLGNAKWTFKSSMAVGDMNLFEVSWTALMAEDSIYFINNILHMRVEVSIQSPAPSC